MRTLLACALLGVCLSTAHAENAVIARAVDGFVRPAYGAFHQAVVGLERDLDALCAAPDAAKLTAARSDFVNTATSWSAVESLRFGPVTENNRLERILFWPDRRSIGLKQVQAAIATQDATATDPKSLADKSVAMQGLGALEFLLFGTGSENLLTSAGAYRCRYGLAVASNLETMASDIGAAWNDPNGIARQWANSGPDNPLFRTDKEAMNQLFNVFVHGLEMIRDVRIGGFLGDRTDDDKPKQAIYWRSNATILSLRAGLGGLAKLLQAADLKPLLNADSAWMPGSAAFEFSNADNALKSVERPPIGDVLADAQSRKKLDYARIVTSSLSDVFGVRLSGALNLTAGFSSLDGD